jgi:hypothetical protein
MAVLGGFQLNESYAVFRPEGPTDIVAFVELLKKAMKACQEHGAKRILVDITLLSHKALSTVDRFNFATGLAAFWDRGIRVALVGRADQVDPERFGALVARNRGLEAPVFTTESEALEWLLEDKQG